MQSQKSISGWKWREYTNDYLHSTFFFEDTLTNFKPMKIYLPNNNQSNNQTPIPKKIRTKLLSVQQTERKLKGNRLKIISKAKFLSQNNSIYDNTNIQEEYSIKRVDLALKMQNKMAMKQLSPQSLKSNSIASRNITSFKSKTEQFSYRKDMNSANSMQNDIKKQFPGNMNLLNQRIHSQMSRRQSLKSKQLNSPVRSVRYGEPSRITIINLDQQNQNINKMYHQKYQDFIKCLHTVHKDFTNLIEQKKKFNAQNKKESVHNVKNFFYG